MFFWLKITKNKQKKSKINCSGFSLVELLVSISILALISGSFLANYRAGQNQSEINIIAQKLASDIRFAQNNSLGSVEFEGDIPAGGWGVHLDKSSGEYIIFADIDMPDGNKRYDGSSEEFRILELPKNVVISDISTISAAPDELDIVFLPPDPITYINGAGNDIVTITLSDTNGTSKKIIVNYFGLIDIEN